MKRRTDCIPNLKETKDFIDLLGPDKQHTFQIFFEKSKQIKGNSKNSRPPEVFFGTFNELNDELYEKNLEGYAVTILINQGDQKGRKAENIKAVRAVFLDLDGASPDKVKAAKFKPHIVVESSEGKYHAYWLVKDCPLKLFSKIQRAIAKNFDGDPKISDLSRVMRLPGFLHQKDEPFVSKLLKIRPDLDRYSVDQIIAGLGLDLDLDEKKEIKSTKDVKATDDKLQVSAEDVEKALSYIPADDREIWLNIGMAIHDFDSSDAGYDLWTDWSAKSYKFDAPTQRDTWNGFKSKRGITIATLFYLAKKYGSSELFSHEQKYSNKYPHTDLGNAEFLVSRILNYFYIVQGAGQMIAWHGSRWVPDKNILMTEAKSAVKAIGEAVKHCSDESFRAALQKYALTCQSKARIDAMVGLAKTDPRIIIHPDKLDKDPFLLGVQNGVIDLRQGELRAETKEDLVTHYSSVAFDPEAKCPRFEQFVAEIMNNDSELIIYLQKLVGYTMTASIKQHCMIMLIGKGRNGKSLLVRIIQLLLGDYAVQLQSTTLMELKNPNHGPTPDLARLPGKRLACVSEVGDTQKLNQPLVKHLTGGDKIPVRDLYQSQIEFEPKFKIWMAGNSKPAVTPKDDAMWKRIHVIPFTRRFVGKDQDKDLPDKLIAELPGILNWAIEGCLLWQKEGLRLPTACKNAIKKYRGQMDTVSKWMEKCCTKSDGCKLPACLAYKSYEGWCQKNNQKPHSNTKFGEIFGKMTPKKRGKKGVSYIGYTLNLEGNKMCELATIGS